VTDKACDMVAGTVETLRDAAERFASNVAETAHGIGRGAEHAYTASRDAVVRAERSVEDFIRRHPVPAVPGTLAVGRLVGCAMSHRD
jgi:ElaB/YqjD/DUF883 family membrane-anchored ribosome-binding protein